MARDARVDVVTTPQVVRVAGGGWNVEKAQEMGGFGGWGGERQTDR